MTQDKVLLENWEHANISFKGLIQKGFQPPIYELGGNETIQEYIFNVSGLKAVLFGVNKDGINFGEDVKSLTNDINHILGT